MFIIGQFHDNIDQWENQKNVHILQIMLDPCFNARNFRKNTDSTST